MTGSVYLESVLNPILSKSLLEFDDELTKFTNKKTTKKVAFNDSLDFKSKASSLFFSKLPLAETVINKIMVYLI